MLLVASALIGYDIEATDGTVGKVADFLFDDTTWSLRWLVVDNSNWLSDRKLLLHPSAIGTAGYERHALTLALTKTQIEASPNIRQDEPVSRQRELSLYDYYGASPLWEGGGYFGGGAIASPLSSPPLFGGADMSVSDAEVLDRGERDPHLRSIVAVTGYHVQAEDGPIGHLANIMIDDGRWDIRYFIVDTKNFWPGKHVLLSPHSVSDVDWLRHELHVHLSRETVRTSPEWDPAKSMDEDFEKRLHAHYNWPAYSFY